jgi:hypothetical protein
VKLVVAENAGSRPRAPSRWYEKEKGRPKPPALALAGEAMPDRRFPPPSVGGINIATGSLTLNCRGRTSVAGQVANILHRHCHGFKAEAAPRQRGECVIGMRRDVYG